MIIRSRVADEDRVTHTANLFGFHFPLHLEPFVYATSLSADYTGGYWVFHTLSNGAFFLAPSGNDRYHVICEYGFEGELWANAFGITACLYAYSRLSFSGMSNAGAQHYHWLRDHAFDHKEAIMRAFFLIHDIPRYNPPSFLILRSPTCW